MQRNPAAQSLNPLQRVSQLVLLPDATIVLRSAVHEVQKATNKASVRVRAMQRIISRSYLCPMP
jgi:hypothetical protein